MATKVGGKDGKPRTSAAVNLIAGGGAGMMEALACHPLGTVLVLLLLHSSPFRQRPSGVLRRRAPARTHTHNKDKNGKPAMKT